MKNREVQWKYFLFHMLLAVLLLVVEVNIVTKIEENMSQDIIYHQADAIKDKIGDLGYTVKGNTYTAISDDPQIAIKNTLQSTNKVEVKFAGKFSKRTKIQVYYQVEGQQLLEQTSRTAYIEEGATEVTVGIPEGKYPMLRLDIDGDFELVSIDFYGSREVNIPFSTKFIMVFVAMLIFAGIVFLLYRSKQELYRQLFDMGLEKIRRYRNSDYGYRGMGDFLRRFLVIFIPLAVLGFIFTNARYINPSVLSEYRWQDGIVVTEVAGYTESEGGYVNHKDKECSLTLIGGENVNKVLLEMNTFAEKNIPILYSTTDQNGAANGKGKTTWKKGTTVIELDLEKKSYNGIQVSIPADFSMNKAYYICGAETQINGVMRHLKVQLLLFFLVVIFMNLSVGKYFSAFYITRLENLKQFIVAHRKKIAFFAVVIFASSLLGLGILKVFVVTNICDWTVKSVLFFILLAWMAAALIFLNKYFIYKVELIGFITILLLGSLFAVIAPGNVGLSWDDQVHYGYAAGLSNGNNSAKAFSDKIIDEYVYVPRPNFDRGMQKSSYQIIDTLEKENCYLLHQGVAWNNLPSWVPYIPSAIGIILARGLNLPYHMQVISGRWMNILFLALLCYFAMRKLKNGKIVVLLIALIPTNIFIASNYTYDTWLTGWSILGISLFMGELQERDKKITTGTMAAIAGCMCLAVMPKMVYFPLTLLVLFMPKRKFVSKGQQYGYYAMVIGAMLLPFLLLYFSTFGSQGGISSAEDTRGGESVSADTQIDYIRSNFVTFVQTIALFLKKYLNPIENGGDYLTNLAYVAHTTKVPYHVIICTIIAGAIFHHEDDARIPWWYRIGTLCVYAGIGIICSVAMYIMFTAVGATEVAGCQGRYLLPVIFPTVYILSRIPFTTKVKTFMDEKGITRYVDIILVGIMLYAGIIEVWDCYVMRY